MLKEYNKEDIESLISNCLASLEIDKLNVANESLNVPFVSGKISTLLFDLNIYLIKYEHLSSVLPPQSFTFLVFLSYVNPSSHLLLKNITLLNIGV